MRLLISVRSVEEALLAARHGADLIDLKEPRAGPLGGLPLPTIRAIVAALRAAGIERTVSATIGDVAASQRAAILERVAQVAACGVDLVKVGIDGSGLEALALLDALAACGRAVVPVFIADHGLDEQVVEHAAALGFAGLMVDTADKRAGSLFDIVATDALRTFVRHAHEAGAQVGLAGALRLADVPALAALGADFAGFRSALCDGARDGALSAVRLRALRSVLRGCAAQPALGALSMPSNHPRTRSISSQ